MGRSRDRVAGFTLIELLVVIAIIALIVSIVLPALGRARSHARIVQCLANHRMLAVSWTAYANDFKERPVDAETDLDASPSSWVDWPRRWGTPFKHTTAELATLTTLRTHIRAVEQGKLFPYVEDVRAYHCIADERDRTRAVPGAALSYVSYSIPYYASPVNLRSISNLRRTSDSYILVEEPDPRGLNMSSWVLEEGAQQWIDPVSVWHDDRGTLGYADGHAEVRVWKDRRTVEMGRNQRFFQPAMNNADYAYFRQRWQR